MLGVLCSGQGGQFAGMFSLFEGESAALAALGDCEAELGVNLRKLVEEGETIFDNRAAQPLICAFQAAAWAGLQARGVEAPRAVAGYSIGELSAYAVAGALDPRPLAALARVRAETMDAACVRPNGLAAIRGLSRSQAETLCAKHGVEIAIVNGFDRFIIGGETAPLTACAAEAETRGAHVTSLPVSIASHTRLMIPARRPFEAALGRAGLRRPQAVVLAGVDGLPLFDSGGAAAALTAQLHQTVEWAACMDGMVEAGCTVLLELGPGAALAGMFRERRPELAARSVCEFKTLAGAAAWAKGQK
jgi:[acyl-carrier-protein] S-malonyltransferase